MLDDVNDKVNKRRRRNGMLGKQNGLEPPLLLLVEDDDGDVINGFDGEKAEPGIDDEEHGGSWVFTRLVESTY